MRARKLVEKYADPSLVKTWYSRPVHMRKLPNVDSITDIFYKSARDFKAGNLSLRDFSEICDDLLFGAYLCLISPKPKLDDKVETALWKFADPSGNEADSRWRLKKEFHEKYLRFVK